MNTDWISINDYLPDEYEPVLISYVDEYDQRMRYIPTVGCLKNNIWHTHEGDVENQNLSYDYFKFHHLIPTHWMILPKAPN